MMSVGVVDGSGGGEKGRPMDLCGRWWGADDAGGRARAEGGTRKE